MIICFCKKNEPPSKDSGNDEDDNTNLEISKLSEVLTYNRCGLRYENCRKKSSEFINKFSK